MISAFGSGIVAFFLVRQVGRGTKNPSRPGGRNEGWRARQTVASDGALAKYYRDRRRHRNQQAHEENLADTRGAVKSAERVIGPGAARRDRKIFPKATLGAEPDL
jgi:hypothetical protein